MKAPGTVLAVLTICLVVQVRSCLLCAENCLVTKCSRSALRSTGPGIALKRDGFSNIGIKKRRQLYWEPPFLFAHHCLSWTIGMRPNDANLTRGEALPVSCLQTIFVWNATISDPFRHTQRHVSCHKRVVYHSTKLRGKVCASMKSTI